jgi:hypothetical protein
VAGVSAPVFGADGRIAGALTLSLPAHGIVNNPAGAAINSYAEIVIIEGYSAGISGATLGQFYYLSTAGNVVNAAPGVGFVQSVGFGLGSLGFYLHIENIDSGGGGGVGPPGPSGPSGSNGIDGVSFWSPQDEAEEALVIPGPPGPQGATGAAGANGTNGAAGAAGAQGDTGPAIWLPWDDHDDVTFLVGPKGDKGDTGASGGGGGGGGAVVGPATVDFGTGGTEASVVVIGQATIASTSKIQVWIQENSTASNTTTDHLFAAVALRFAAGAIVAGTGFTIYATSIAGFAAGQFTVNWSWT